jgi:hypothetical protein
MRVAPQRLRLTPGHLRNPIARHAGHLLVALAAVLVLAATPAATHAQSLDLELIPSTAHAGAGDTVTFSGRITNTTGAALLLSEMFLNFIGYDPDVMEFIQVLGDPDSMLPNNTFSAIIPLFRVFIGVTAQAGQYAFGVSLQDINNFTSGTVEASVTVDAVSTVPEPAALVLFATGAGTLLLRRRRRRT